MGGSALRSWVWWIAVPALCAGTTFRMAAAEDARVERNVFIEMRDGVRLATDLHLPALGRDTRVPVVLVRTPYGKDPRYFETREQSTSIIRFLTEHGYAVAVQDIRGRFNSEGTFTVASRDAEDGYDTIDWLSQQDWSNGKVGTYGCSYEGNVQIYLAQARHPALKAMVPQASGGGVGSLGGHYRDFSTRVGGAIEWAGSVGWFAEWGEKQMPRLDADLPRDQYNAIGAPGRWVRHTPTLDYAQAWYHLPMKAALRSQGLPITDFEDHVARAPSDPYWQGLPHMTDDYVSDVPALFINSWYDFGTDMTLVEFNHFSRQSASPHARKNQYVILSPHIHCSFARGASVETVVGERALGDTRFDYLSTYLTWFDAWLKDDADARKVIGDWPKVRYFAMGRDRWQEAPTWPLPDTSVVNLYLTSAGSANSLSGDGRLAPMPDTSGAIDTFTYDPANPVPSRGGPLCCTGTLDMPAGAMDQRAVEARSDVLVYTSDVLGKELEVTGDAFVVLHVSSDVIDTDFTAKLVDVHPNGKAFNVLEGILRTRYRDGLDKEVWLRAGKVHEITIALGPTSNVFLPGHRIRLEVSSSNFPRFDRNLNVGGNNAEQTTWAVARNSVHHTDAHPSRLVLPVVGKGRSVAGR